MKLRAKIIIIISLVLVLTVGLSTAPSKVPREGIDALQVHRPDHSLDVGPVGIENDDNEMLPAKFSLSQNYPNPFNPTTTISYQIPKSGNVKLEIFNIVGQKVRTLINKKQKADCYNVTWDGKNEAGNSIASGIYFYRLSVNAGQKENSFVKSKKMLFVK